MENREKKNTHQIFIDGLFTGFVVGFLYFGLFERVSDVQGAGIEPSCS
jgi:hypothetical protein